MGTAPPKKPATPRTQALGGWGPARREVWKNAAFWHICGVRLYDGLYQGVQVTNLFYYLTYILAMHGVERSVWILVRAQ